MKDKLKKLLENSYSPYSKFKVSCIVLMKDNREFSGVNVENSSYGATICAERVAITKAISEGYKKGDFEKLYIMCDTNIISSCCMVCRQVISEFFEPNKEIISFNKDGNFKTYTVEELCPYPFSAEDLK